MMHMQRNSGCRILVYSIHGIEAVTMENRSLRISILSGKGADIFELLDKRTDTDFMYRDPVGLERLKQRIPGAPIQQGSFWDYHVGGWYELFPNSGPATSCQGADIGMHGEVMFLPWNYVVESDTKECVRIRFWVKTLRTPFLLERIMEIRDDDPVLYIQERLTNLGSTVMPYLWGHHVTLGESFLNPECDIMLPPATKVHSDTSYASSASRVVPGTAGSLHRMPAKGGGYVDVSKVSPKHIKTNEMLFSRKMKQSWYAVYNPRRELGFALAWDPVVFPYLWIWQEFHASEEFPFYGQCCALALEPQASNVPMLGEAVASQAVPLISPGSTISTWMTASIFRDIPQVENVMKNGTILSG